MFGLSEAGAALPVLGASGTDEPVPDLTAKPSVYWLCATHYGQVSNEDIVARLRQGRGHPGKP